MTNSEEQISENTYHIILNDLTVGYDGVPLIRDMQIGIRKGEIVSLIGPNGSGKSTVLKSLVRQLPPVAGTICLSGKDLIKMPEAALAKHMAVVLTDRVRAELMTCYDIVATGRYPYTGRFGKLTPEDEEKVEEAIRLVHAEEIGKRNFNAISDGQKQRVLLARAIAQEPEILILDEPTSYLDMRYKLELLTILKRLSRERGMTVIMSLHEIDLAQRISDNILCIREEHTFAYGTPDEIFRGDILRELYGLDSAFIDPCFRDYLPAGPGSG